MRHYYHLMNQYFIDKAVSILMVCTCRVVHLKRRCDRRCADFHIRSSSTRVGLNLANDCYPADSFAFRGTTVVNDNVADVYYESGNKQKREKHLK